MALTATRVSNVNDNHNNSISSNVNDIHNNSNNDNSNNDNSNNCRPFGPIRISVPR